MRLTLARNVLERRRGAAAEEARPLLAAVRGALGEMQLRLGGTGGAIAIGADGEIALAHTTSKMAWATGRYQGGERVVRAGLRFGEGDEALLQ